VAGGEGRAETALRQAAASPLLDIPLEGASGILVNVAGGQDMGIHEIQAVVNELKQLASPDARIVFGAVVDSNPLQTLSVTLIATGFGESGIASRDPWSRRAAAGDDAPVAPVPHARTIERVATEPVGAPTATVMAEPPAPSEPEIREVARPAEANARDNEVPAFIRRQRLDGDS